MQKISLIKSWHTGNNSTTLIIPKKIAKKYGIDKPTNLILFEKPDGILIKKLEVKN